MFSRLKTWLKVLSDSKAVTTLEYGIIAGIIVVTVLAGFNNVGSNLNRKITNVAAKLT